MTIKFGNGKTLPYIEAIETEEYFNGSSRRTMTFNCNPEDVSLDELNVILSDESNTEVLTLTNEEMDITNMYDGYVLKLELGIKPTMVNNDPPTYEDRVVFKLGKRTEIEKQLHKLGLID